MKRKKSKRVKQRRSAPRVGNAAPAREDLNLASRALLRETDNPRSARTPPDDASVEDPLLDWPED